MSCGAALLRHRETGAFRQLVRDRNGEDRGREVVHGRSKSAFAGFGSCWFGLLIALVILDCFNRACLLVILTLPAGLSKDSLGGQFVD